VGPGKLISTTDDLAFRFAIPEFHKPGRGLAFRRPMPCALSLPCPTIPLSDGFKRYLSRCSWNCVEDALVFGLKAKCGKEHGWFGAGWLAVPLL